MSFWNYREQQPRGPLAKYIDCIWTEDFYKVGRNKNHHIVPDHSVELIFSKASMARDLGDGAGKQQMQSHLVGLKTRPQLVSFDESPVIGVRFRPHGLYPFLKGSVRNTIDHCLLPETAFGKGINRLEEQVLEAQSFEERFAFIVDFFTSELNRVGFYEDPLFDELQEVLELSAGSVPIHKLSLKFGVSVKTVERRFLTYMGITPKKYALSLRVIEALKSSRVNKTESLVFTAHQFGFFDQAHFIKEVKKYTGLLPKDFVKRDMGVQLPIYH